MINYGGIWGTWIGFAGGIAADVDDSDRLLSLALVVGNLSTAVVAALSPKLELSFAQTNLINLSGIVGTIVSSGLILINLPDSERVTLGTLLTGGILGLAGGYLAFGRNAEGVPQSLDRGESVWASNEQRYKTSSDYIQASLMRIAF